MIRIALFDYGAGNLHSLEKGLRRGHAEVEITTDWDRALTLDALVLPGVGAFGPAAAALPVDPTYLKERLAAGFPLLGICLGMQLLFSESDEAAGRGIDLVPGRVRRLDTSVVPQMGWNDVEVSADPLFAGVAPLVAYYANSFVCEPEDAATVIGRSRYEEKELVAAVRTANSWGVQFHPEKSSAAGRRILENFVGIASRLSRGEEVRR